METIVIAVACCIGAIIGNIIGGRLFWKDKGGDSK